MILPAGSRRVTALYRQPSYSPAQHRTNDAAIMDAVVAYLENQGWRAKRAVEGDVISGRPSEIVQDADVVLNMCQGPQASRVLLGLEEGGTLLVNRPSSVLGCHRHRLVEILAASKADPRADITFPRTVITSTTTSAALDGFEASEEKVWVKRGDVHAERQEDVVAVSGADLPVAMAAFAARGIQRVALQEHISGPILKFYGVADGSFFRFYGADAGPTGPRPVVDEEQLRAVAFAAAARLGLDVFGGDVALPEPRRPILIDLNDWPSFAPFRGEAAGHIARYVMSRVMNPGHESGRRGAASTYSSIL